MPNKPPVLAIDARLYGNRSGAGRIATATVDRLAKDYPDAYSKIVLFAHSRKVFEALPEGRNVKKVLINCHFLLGKLFLVPFWLLAHRADVYFSPTSELPVWKPFGTKYVNMVHDLFMEEILDETVGEERGLLVALRHLLNTKRFLDSYYLAGFFRSAFSFADQTIAISEFSKSQLIDFYGISPEKVEVIYIAAGDDFFLPYSKLETRDTVSAKYGFTGSYFFSYDATADYASLANVISKCDNFGGFKWVILNRFPEATENLKYFTDRGDVVIIKDYLSDEDLISLIRGCEFVFFPSRWEGFGLPIAESLATGKFVLLPNSTAMPEIGGDYVYVYEPSSSRDLSDVFSRICSSYSTRPEPSSSEFVRKYRWDSFSTSLTQCLAGILN